MALLRLFDPVNQFQTKSGALNTAGLLRVYLNGTDDYAAVHDDNGTLLEQPVRLDNNGRAPGLFVDSGKVYRLEVQDRYGSLLFTVMNMVPSGGGAGSSLGDRYDVVSSDGSISVDRSVDAGTTTYDIGLAPNDSDEFLDWIKCSEKDCGATWYPVFNDGSMDTEAGKGIKVHGGHLYHFTNSFTVDPDGTGVNYDTFRVTMYCGDAIVDEHDFDIDSSLNDPVLCEFSRDVVPSEDTHVYFKLTIPATCKASGEVQCHRIYSGINAVPDTCATKQWVQETFDYSLSSKVDYSAIGYNGNGQISGINGSAIAGGLDSASVSSIASSVASAYTESAFSSLSSKADSSALSSYQPVSAMGAYSTTAYVDGMVSGKLDTTAFNSGDFYPTSNPSGFITGVDLTPYQEKSAMTAYQPSGNYYSASNPSGFITGVDLGGYATTGFVESAVSGKLDTTAFNQEDFYTTANESGFVGRAYVDSSVSGKLDTSAFASASAGFQPTGDYAYNSALTSYIPASASGAFQPIGDYAFNSAVSSKLDASASGDFVMNTAMTSWIPYFELDYSGTVITGIGGSSLVGMGGGTGDYVEKSATEVAIGSGTTALRTSFAQGVNCGASSNSFAQGSDNTKVQSYSFAQGSANTATRNSLAQGYYNIAQGEGFAQGSLNKAGSYSFAQGDGNKASYGSFAQGLHNTAGWISYDPNATEGYSFAQGIGNSAVYSAAVFGTYNLHGNGNTATGDSAAFAIGDGTANTARHDLMLVTKNGEITMYSSTADTVGIGLVSSIKAISAAATGGVDSATVSAIASAYTTGKQDTLAFAYNTANQISSINGSALGGMDEAAVSGIASAYAQSAASSKLDTTAFNSGDFYSTSNPSGFVDSAYVDSAVSRKLDTTAFNSGDFYSTSNPSGFITGVDLSPYQPTSAMSGYIPTSLSSDFQQTTGMSSYALSSDVSATVDIVGTQSANWGGSALQLSAGPGVKLEKSGNVLVASTDETVLWSGNPSAYISSVTLPEAWSNFDRVRFYWNPHTDERCWTISEVPTNTDYIHLETVWLSNNTSYKAVFGYAFSSTDHKSFTQYNGGFNNITGAANWTNSNECKVMKIVGINRTAGV